jgi:hypothetical protein
MGLLDRHHPRVDDPEMKMLPFPAEGPWSRPCFDQEVVAFLEAFAIVHGIGVRCPALNADSPHDAGDHAPARNHIHQRDFFR